MAALVEEREVSDTIPSLGVRVALCPEEASEGVKSIPLESVDQLREAVESDRAFRQIDTLYSDTHEMLVRLERRFGVLTKAWRSQDEALSAS